MKTSIHPKNSNFNNGIHELSERQIATVSGGNVVSIAYTGYRIGYAIGKHLAEKRNR